MRDKQPEEMAQCRNLGSRRREWKPKPIDDGWAEVRICRTTDNK